MRQATHISPSRFLEQYIPTLGETTPYVFKTYTVCYIPVSDIGRPVNIMLPHLSSWETVLCEFQDGECRYSVSL